MLIPTAVADELQRGSENDPRIATTLSQDWIEVRQPRNIPQVESLQQDRNLDRGESEAIALALELNAEGLLIDERLGRIEARRLGLSIVGVLGLLLVAKRRGLVSAVQPIIDDLINEAGFRVSNPLDQEVLRAAGETWE